MESEHSWYYLHRSHQVGPYTFAELYMLLAKEVIAPTTWVWSPGRGGWREFQDVSGHAPKPEPKPHRTWLAATFGVTMFLTGLTAVERAPTGTEPGHLLAAAAVPKDRPVVLERLRLYKPDAVFLNALNASPPPRHAAAMRSLLPDERLELELWRSVALSNEVDRYEFFLRQYPSGPFAATADAKIRKLRKPVVLKAKKKSEKKHEVVSSPGPTVPRTTALKAPPPKPIKRCTHRNREQCRERCNAGDTLACHKIQRLGD